MKSAYRKLVTKYEEMVKLKEPQVLLQQKINAYQNELRKSSYLYDWNKSLVQKNTFYK
jgi:hypothetical protein